MKNLLILLTLFTLFSCHEKEQQTTAEFPIVFDFTNISESDVVSVEDGYQCRNYYKTIDAIKLDTAGLLSSIGKIRIYDDKLFVYDSRSRNSKLNVYNFQTGKFLCQIGKNGKCPGEFNSFSDFEIDTNRKQIVCCDMWGEKLVRFNFDGELEKEDKLDFSPTEIAIKDSFYYFQNCPDRINNCYLIITDNKFNILKSAIKDEGEYKGSYNREFTSYNGNLLVSFSGVDTIFKLNGLEMEPYVCFNLPKNQEAVKSHHPLRNNEVYYFSENDKFLRTSVHCARKRYTAVFDKQKKKNVIFSSKGTRDPDFFIRQTIYYSHPDIGDVIKSGGEYFFNRLAPELLKQNYDKPTKRFVDIVKAGYDPNDNPLLVILK